MTVYSQHAEDSAQPRETAQLTEYTRYGKDHSCPQGGATDPRSDTAPYSHHLITTHRDHLPCIVITNHAAMPFLYRSLLGLAAHSHRHVAARLAHGGTTRIAPEVTTAVSDSTVTQRAREVDGRVRTAPGATTSLRHI